jgi:hypothetical protein
MGHIKIRNGATGQVDNVDETITSAELRQKWGLSPDFSFVSDQSGERIPEGEEIGRYVQNEGTVTPLIEPRFGASSPSSSFVFGWHESSIKLEFPAIKQVFPDAELSEDSTILTIPRFPLNRAKFNKSSTRLRISFNRKYQWMGGPAIYADSDLKVFGSKSGHLDLFLTEPKMLAGGWHKLCWYNVPRTRSVIELLQNVVNFMEKLRD